MALAPDLEIGVVNGLRDLASAPVKILSLASYFPPGVPPPMIGRIYIAREQQLRSQGVDTDKIFLKLLSDVIEDVVTESLSENYQGLAVLAREPVPAVESKLSSKYGLSTNALVNHPSVCDKLHKAIARRGWQPYEVFQKARESLQAAKVQVGGNMIGGTANGGGAFSNDGASDLKFTFVKSTTVASLHEKLDGILDSMGTLATKADVDRLATTVRETRQEVESLKGQLKVKDAEIDNLKKKTEALWDMVFNDDDN